MSNKGYFKISYVDMKIYVVYNRVDVVTMYRILTKFKTPSSKASLNIFIQPQAKYILHEAALFFF
jgi:hypothetical protein